VDRWIDDNLICRNRGSAQRPALACTPYPFGLTRRARLAIAQSFVCREDRGLVDLGGADLMELAAQFP
jgi:hypothetical protein